MEFPRFFGKRAWLLAGATAVIGWRAIRRLRAANLSGKVALVTGGSRGLGLYLARELGRQGCKVAICARDLRDLDAARQDLSERGMEVLAVPCDVQDRAQVHALVEQVTVHFGRIDIVVNNAGLLQGAAIETTTVADFELAMDTNFFGGVNVTLAVLPQMRARREGRIVNITSIGGDIPMPHLLPYDCAKFAALGFSEGLRAELAGEGIDVTTVVPGLLRAASPPAHGRPAQEGTWFAQLAEFPLSATNARRAARRIVQAVRFGEAEVTLSWPAKVLRLVHALFPGLTTDLLAQMNRRVLPPLTEDRRAPLSRAT
jgi:NAD(P)-dependent dehydrogenase (short-subunit alcohol dehydrogenase family)